MYCSFSGKFLLSNLRTKSEFKLQDVHSTVTKIYIGFQSTLSPNNGVIVSGVLNELVQNLITLKSDPVIKAHFSANFSNLDNIFLISSLEELRVKVKNVSVDDDDDVVVTSSSHIHW